MTKRPLRTETLAAIGAALTSTHGEMSKEGIQAAWKNHKREVVGALELNGYSKKEANDAFVKISALVYVELGRFAIDKSRKRWFEDKEKEYNYFKELVADILARVPRVVMR